MDDYYMLMHEINAAMDLLFNLSTRVLKAYPTPPELESDKLMRRAYDEVIHSRDVLGNARELLKKAKATGADEERKGLR